MRGNILIGLITISTIGAFCMCIFGGYILTIRLAKGVDMVELVDVISGIALFFLLFVAGIKSLFDAVQKKR